MSITYESAHKRYREAREEYLQLESQLAVVRAKMNNAERECSVEWRKILDARTLPSSERAKNNEQERQ